ncbi:UTP-glucose-1-phosphate uridylyltransferase [Paraburkholderia hospita]|uniref:UTP-glucose-1-phosphate uridylyltransferase n=1 Tax=Paraburkholderia hospita TaxID=169430 RepID=A0ABN0FLA9_9BURK|nr:UTP-glucose-1-phosphate uridylyltransferase [Paraburkholderia hospita]
MILADDLLYGKPPVMQQMIEVFDHYHSPVIGVEEIPSSETKSYGIVEEGVGKGHHQDVGYRGETGT